MVEFRDPPPIAPGAPGIGRGKWQRIATELKARPGDWAIVDEDVSVTMANSAAQSLRAEGCEMTRRRQENGNYDIYARYVGGDNG